MYQNPKQYFGRKYLSGKSYFPWFILSIVVGVWYRYAMLHLLAVLILLIIGIFTGDLFTRDGLFWGGWTIVLYLDLYFLNQRLERL